MPRRGKGEKAEEATGTLMGWKAIAAYLGIGEAAAQRWAKTGMPVRREGRFTVAEVEDIRRWLGKEAHMSGPAHVLTKGTDVAEALKESISGLRHRRQKKKPS